MKRTVKVFGSIMVAGLAALAGYAGYAYTTYRRRSPQSEDESVLDAFMPDFEVFERHQTSVSAPAEVTTAAAHEVSFYDSPVVKLLFEMRALPSRLMGTYVPPPEHRSTMEEVRALGWKELGDEPGRWIAMGAVTQPWKKDVVFHGLSPEEFVAFGEPGYAKISWTLEVDSTGPLSSVFRTETRVSTTDPNSREKFRRYWSFLSPGIILIRYEMLRLVKSEAERRASET